MLQVCLWLITKWYRERREEEEREGTRQVEGQGIEGGCGWRKVGEGESSGWADRGPFILHARADRELALGDTAHKSETITPC